MTRDSGSIVFGWLTRLALVIAVLGLLAFDGIALVKTHFTAADHAGSAASAAADTYRTTRNVQQAYDVALAAVATTPGDTIDPRTFIVDPATGNIRLTLVEDAVTLWVHRVGPLKKYVVISATAEGSPPP